MAGVPPHELENDGAENGLLIIAIFCSNPFETFNVSNGFYL